MPTIGKTLGLSALSGLASEGASQAFKSITRKGVKTGGFIVPQNRMHQLIPYKDLLNMEKKEDLLHFFIYLRICTNSTGAKIIGHKSPPRFEHQPNPLLKF